MCTDAFEKESPVVETTIEQIKRLYRLKQWRCFAVLKAADFFDLEANRFASLFNDSIYVWEGLVGIKSFIKEHLKPNVQVLRRGKALVAEDLVLYNGEVLHSDFKIDTSGKKTLVRKDGAVLEGASIIYAGAYLMDDEIYIGKNTVIEPTALIKGPAIIGDRTEVRHGAYVRGNVLIGDDCVVGHTTEIKSSVMLGGSKAGHFAYIGDSILGQVNLGAGTKLANLKMVDTPVVLNVNNREYQTGLRKFGAILGDGVETGCNSVTTPGTLLSKNVLLYPNTTARGFYPSNTLVKVFQEQEFKNIEKP